jgi:multiple antibiotic resistance protein
MAVDWELIGNFMVALLAVVNPIEKIPLWVKASEGGRRSFQMLLAGLVIVSSGVILLVFLWVGQQLLDSLQIELASFKIGGGLILLQFGFSMLKGTAVELHQPDADDDQNLKSRVIRRYHEIFIPIGVPVIAGPGAITTVIIYGYQSPGLSTRVVLSLAVAASLAILYLTLMTGPYIQQKVGELPLNLISRVFGMILIAIAVQFMVDGLQTVFPGWAGGV